MTTEVKKVNGGYQLFIPDDLAAETGLREGVAVEMVAMAEMLLVSQPEFVEAAREASAARITPETLHNGQEPYPPPAGFGLERAG